MKNAWPIFALAAVLIFITPFPGLAMSSMLGGSGMYMIAKIVLFVTILAIGGAVARGSVDLRSGICMCIAAYLVVGALAHSSFESLRYLLPLPVLALVRFHDSPELAEDNPVSGLPLGARQVAAMVLALIGSTMIVGGFNGLHIRSAFDIDYIPLWLGLVGYGSAVFLLTTPFGRGTATSLAIGAYIVILSLFAMGLIAEMAIGQRAAVSDKNLVILVVAAMLLVQTWRNFGRPGGWLKIVEGAIGGMIVALAASFVFDTLRGLGHWAVLAGIFYLPFILIAAAMIYLGMRMIWSDESHLGRFFRARA